MWWRTTSTTAGRCPGGCAAAGGRTARAYNTRVGFGQQHDGGEAASALVAAPCRRPHTCVGRSSCSATRDEPLCQDAIPSSLHRMHPPGPCPLRLSCTLITYIIAVCPPQNPLPQPLPTAHCPCPCSYEFLYKQAVDTADNFLGMSSKDPSSTSCEDLVVRIQLPGAEGAAGGAGVRGRGTGMGTDGGAVAAGVAALGYKRLELSGHGASARSRTV